MHASESTTSWIWLCSYCKTNNTRAQRIQVSFLIVDVDFKKSCYKMMFSCNLDAKYFEDRLLRRNFSRKDSGWVKCWWNIPEIQHVLLLTMTLQSRPMQLPVICRNICPLPKFWVQFDPGSSHSNKISAAHTDNWYYFFKKNVIFLWTKYRIHAYLFSLVLVWVLDTSQIMDCFKQLISISHEIIFVLWHLTNLACFAGAFFHFCSICNEWKYTISNTASSKEP